MTGASEPHWKRTGAAIRAAREGMGASLSDLADRSGISKTSLHAYETGRRELANGAERAIAQGLAGLLTERTEGK